LASSLICIFEEDLHENGKTTRLYDDIHSAQLWWDIQVCFVFSFSFYRLTVEKDQMPEVDKLPHCFLPLISDAIKAKSQHHYHASMLARAGFLPQEIRDGSGMEESTVGLHDKGQLYLFF